MDHIDDSKAKRILRRACRHINRMFDCSIKPVVNHGGEAALVDSLNSHAAFVVLEDCDQVGNIFFSCSWEMLEALLAKNAKLKIFKDTANERRWLTIDLNSCFGTTLDEMLVRLDLAKA